jgi:hypothetical protein
MMAGRMHIAETLTCLVEQATNHSVVNGFCVAHQNHGG